MLDWISSVITWVASLHTSARISELIGAGGIVFLTVVVFAETGLLVGFFLPGDSLLITAGVLANPANPHHILGLEIWQLNVVLALAAVIGDQVGFFLGAKTGARIWARKDGRFFKRRHLEEAHAFYEKWGPFAVIGARYVPILRTFVPFVAGVARMPYRTFVWANVFGGILWVTSMLWLGYFLGQTPMANRLDKLIVIVVLVSVMPMVVSAARRGLKRRGRR